MRQNGIINTTEYRAKKEYPISFVETESRALAESAQGKETENVRFRV